MTLPRRFSATAAAVSALGLIAGAASLSTAAPVLAQAAAPATAPAGCTGPVSDTWINVIVQGVKNDNGLIAVTVYADDSSRFLVKKGSLYVGRVDARTGTTRACVFLPSTGVYALAVYHDEDGDKSFDRNGLGLPAEAYGFSNNPVTLAGLPQFRSVRLNVAKNGLATKVTLTYP